MADAHDDHQARIDRLDVLIARATTVPSLPELAAQIRNLTQTVATLTAQVEALQARV